MYAAGNVWRYSATYPAMPWPMLRRLAAHLTALADSRALLSAGRRIEINRAMMPMTTNNSTNVNARAPVAQARLVRARMKTSFPETEVDGPPRAPRRGMGGVLWA